MELGSDEGRLRREHPVNRLEQFPHDGDVGLDGFLPPGHELVEEGFDVRLVLYSHRDRMGKRAGPWFLWDGSREWRVERLSEQELRAYPPLGVWNDTLLIERIVAGWSHDQDS